MSAGTMYAEPDISDVQQEIETATEGQSTGGGSIGVVGCIVLALVILGLAYLILHILGIIL
jgi:hypothetical protein